MQAPNYVQGRFTTSTSRTQLFSASIEEGETIATHARIPNMHTKRIHHQTEPREARGASLLARTVLDLAVPTRCLSCATWAEVDHLGLCRVCRSGLERLSGARCVQCLSTRLGSGSHHCLRCIVDPPSYQRLFALYDYRPPFDGVIQALKFRRLAYLAETLGRLAWDKYAEELCRVDILVPIPLPWLRRLKRGFNQAEAMASTVGKLLQRPIVQPLTRRGLQEQSSLDSGIDRRRNARKTMHLKPTASASVRRVRKKHVLIVDDLVTSGATANRATELLLHAGAARVWVLAAGHRQ